MPFASTPTSRVFAGFAACVASVLVSAAAGAQAISLDPINTYAVRHVGTQNLGPSTRSLNPYGVNYSDCIQDMKLELTVDLTGFAGQDNMQVWATYGQDCALSGRGTDGSTPTCWLVDSGLTATSATSYTSVIPVRALVAPENGSIPPAGTLEGDQGPDACTHQQSFAGVPVTIFFLPLLPSGELDTTASPGVYQYPTFTADLVGPPPPANVTIDDGDTLFTVNWNANGDSDTQGYDVFIDPPPNSHPEAGTALQPEVLFCPDAGSASVSVGEDAASEAKASSPEAEASVNEDATAIDGPAEATPGSEPTEQEEASDDAAGDAALETGTAVVSSDGQAPDGCTYANGGGQLPGSSTGMCVDAVLSVAPVFAAGFVTDAIDAESTDSGTSTSTLYGGIGSLICKYLEGGSCGAASPAYMNTGDPSVLGVSSTSMTITGLTNGVTYNVVVAAVDGSGNVGPQSTPNACDYPAPINDFFKTYRLDGGGAGGGFCSLGAVGLPHGASIFAIVVGALSFGFARRRRVRRQRS